MQFRKKPVVIEACQYLSNYDNLPEWARKAGCEVWREGRRSMEVHTLEGTMLAISGDWIIRGIKGEVYPCRPDIFDATYEKAED
jgi:hypothetical protein